MAGMNFVLKRNDKDYKVTYTITEQNGSTVNLTGASVQFHVGNNTSIIINNPATIESALTGIVSYTFSDQDTLFDGLYTAEFVVTFADGSILSYPRSNYLTVNIQKNVDLNQTNISIGSIAQKQGDYDAKLTSILAQAGNLGLSSMEEAQWTATDGQLTYVMPTTVNYSADSKWMSVFAGNSFIEPSLVDRNISGQITLLVPSSQVTNGTIVTARWSEPMIPNVDLSTFVKQNMQTPIVETYTATSGQVLFPLVSSYTIGSGLTRVTIDGVPQSLTIDYTESGTKQITLVEGAPLGAVVKIFIYTTDSALTNYVNTINPHLTSIDSQFGTATLTTTSQNIKGAVNEVNASLASKANQTDVNKFASQSDYVDLIRNRKSYNRMRFQKTQDVSPFIGTFALVVDDGGKHSTYSFTKDTDDDFIKINNCFVGDLGSLTTGYDDGTKTGTWQGTSPNLFTQQVGATITGSVKGQSIYFNRRLNSNGGIWSVVVDSLPAVTVSCWSSTDSTYAVPIKIVDNLDRNVSHTVTATFQGDDPSHVPASGAGTGRGYANITNDAWYNGNGYPDIQGFITAYIPDGNLANSNYLLDQSSNKEFAFNITYGTWTNWVPEHNLTPVIYQIDVPIYKVDGQTFDITTLKLNQMIDCSDFKLIQHLNVKASGVNIAEVKFIHHIDKNGVMSVTGNFKALVDLTMNNMYPLMLPSKQGVLSETISGIGNSKVSINDGSDYYFTEEVDQTKSMALISSTFPNYIAAGTVENQFKTMRIGKSKGTLPVNNSMRYWQQLNAPKTYWTAAQNILMPTGSSYSWFGKLAVAEIQNIYDYVKGNF